MFSILYHSNQDSQSQNRQHCFAHPSLSQKEAGLPDQQHISGSTSYKDVKVVLWQKRQQKEGGKVHRIESVSISTKKGEREGKAKGSKKTMDIDIQHESSHDPRNWNIFTFTPFDYLKKRRFFHSLLSTQKDSSSALEDFFLSIRM